MLRRLDAARPYEVRYYDAAARCWLVFGLASEANGGSAAAFARLRGLRVEVVSRSARVDGGAS